MPPVDRNAPRRTVCSEFTYSLMEFLREFSDDAAYLEHLWCTRYAPDGEHAICPKCAQERVYRRYATKQGRQSWTYTGCGAPRPPDGQDDLREVFDVSLHLWFYAMYLVTGTRCGISAKQLERTLGVSYRTAWRMLNLIRNQLMTDDGEQLSGHVEVDETSVDGQPRKGYLPKAPIAERRSAAMKLKERSRATVFAAVERGGRVKTTVLPSRRGPRLKEQVVEWVQPDSIVYTDEWPAYNRLGAHFAAHSRVRHAAGEYVMGDVYTNTIEGFFGNLKPSIRGTYKKVSHKWLQGYLNEFCWRYNLRDQRDPSMFAELLKRAAK